MGPLLEALPNLLLRENTTGTAYLLSDPTLHFGRCSAGAGRAKEWDRWWGHGEWHRADAVQYAYARAPVVERPWTALDDGVEDQPDETHPRQTLHDQNKAIP
jgi:hypothetical protein